MNKVFGILAVVIIGLATWLGLSHFSFIDKINSWQGEMMGDNKFFPVLTIFILALPPLLLLLLVKKMILKAGKK